jgi:hypothetical protein
MKRLAGLVNLILLFLFAAPGTPAQKGCELNIIGSWSTSGPSGSIVYTFTADGIVKAMSRTGSQDSELREIGRASYMLDDPKAPKLILFRETPAGGKFPLGTTAIDIAAYDDASLTIKLPGQVSTRWTRYDPNRYFMVLAGRIRTFYDGSGPTFPMMIRTDGRKTEIDAVGTYPSGNSWAFGPIPPEIYNQFMAEPRNDAGVMLRLEISAAQYERGLKIVRTWERRVREGALLYGDTRLDNILLAKQVAESLNQCGDTIKLYKLDWSLEDRISSSSPKDDNPISRIPFLFFKELRRMNESLHVGDRNFFTATHTEVSQSGR